MDIKQLTAPDVQNVYDSMLQRGLSNRTVRYTHSVLSSAMNELVKKGAIKVNPCLQTVLPKRSRKEIRHMSPDQACVFLKATRPDRFSVLFRLALETGMRPEEYLALQWKDIDFKHSFLSVRRAISWSRDDGKYEFIEPKTVRSRRRIPLSASMVSALQKHRSFQAQENDRHIDLNLVFPSARGTPVQPRNLRNRHFFPILEKAGLERFRLYDLRHTMATLMLAAGENPKVVSERLGHASIVITLDTYSHVLPTLQREATDRLAKILASPRFRASS
jgi:integrase